MVEDRVGQCDIASSQSFSIIHLRISLSPDPAPPVNIGELANMTTRREPPPEPDDSARLLHMCCRNSSELSLTRGKPAFNGRQTCFRALA